MKARHEGVSSPGTTIRFQARPVDSLRAISTPYYGISLVWAGDSLGWRGTSQPMSLLQAVVFDPKHTRRCRRQVCRLVSHIVSSTPSRRSKKAARSVSGEKQGAFYGRREPEGGLVIQRGALREALEYQTKMIFLDITRAD